MWLGEGVVLLPTMLVKMQDVLPKFNLTEKGKWLCHPFPSRSKYIFEFYPIVFFRTCTLIERQMYSAFAWAEPHGANLSNQNNEYRVQRIVAFLSNKASINWSGSLIYIFVTAKLYGNKIEHFVAILQDLFIFLPQVSHRILLQMWRKISSLKICRKPLRSFQHPGL